MDYLSYQELAGLNLVRGIMKVKSGIKYLIIVSVTSLGFLSGEETKWIAIGNLHNWYSEAGSEQETGRTGQVRDQQDGLRWPAQFSAQDCQAAKGMWIGAKNYHDPVAGTDFDYKVVHVGPRHLDLQSETIPKKFTYWGKFDHPDVYVDFIPATNMQYTDIVDSLNPDLPADRMLETVMQTSMGIKLTRKIYAFSNQYHDNYFIYDYLLENNGVYDKDGNITHDQTLEDVYLFFQYRYSVSREGAVYDGNWLPQSAAWGHNTINEVIGENPYITSPSDQFFEDGEMIRALYSWHGRHSGASFDNIGAPNVKGDGHLGAAQFVGCVTIHADNSPADNNDNLYQPMTTRYVGSDEYITTAGNDQFNPSRMSAEYAAMAAGHPAESHAEAVCGGTSGPGCDSFADQWTEPGKTNPGGYSQGQGFGPYTLAPGEKVRIVLAEGVAGLSRELCYEIGANWINDTPGELPGGGDPANRHDYKNQWVFTGLDSLIQTFKRARENFRSDFDIPSPPPPPSTFNVAGQGDRIALSWDPNAEAWSGFAGYQIYRAIHQPDTTYELIYDGPAGINSFDDVTAVRGFDYFYYIITYDDGSAFDGHTLVSSKFFTMTNKPASLKRSPGRLLDDIRIVPNPFSISARNIQYGTELGKDRIMFLNIPGKCRIRIFTERGDLVKTINHIDGSGDERWNSETDSRQVIVSGLYIAHFEVTEDIKNPATGEMIFRKGESTFKKFIVVR